MGGTQANIITAWTRKKKKSVLKALAGSTWERMRRQTTWHTRQFVHSKQSLNETTTPPSMLEDE